MPFFRWHSKTLIPSLPSSRFSHISSLLLSPLPPFPSLRPNRMFFLAFWDRYSASSNPQQWSCAQARPSTLQGLNARTSKHSIKWKITTVVIKIPKPAHHANNQQNPLIVPSPTTDRSEETSSLAWQRTIFEQLAFPAKHLDRNWGDIFFLDATAFVFDFLTFGWSISSCFAFFRFRVFLYILLLGRHCHKPADIIICTDGIFFLRLFLAFLFLSRPRFLDHSILREFVTLSA